MTEVNLTWLLVLPALGFAVGWLASRFDMRQVKREEKDSPRAYYKGLNLLLNEQQDKAIDAFIEAVQNDPDTTELHFALGNLFRRRGEFERSVRVHQHLLSRADLNRTDRDRAQHAQGTSHAEGQQHHDHQGGMPVEAEEPTHRYRLLVVQRKGEKGEEDEGPQEPGQQPHRL